MALLYTRLMWTAVGIIFYSLLICRCTSANRTSSKDLRKEFYILGRGYGRQLRDLCGKRSTDGVLVINDILGPATKADHRGHTRNARRDIHDCAPVIRRLNR